MDDPKGVAKQVDRLLASPRLEDGARAYFADMLGFDGFDNLAKDPAIYPKYSFGLATDAQEQTLRTITDHLLTRNGDYRDLFTTRDMFLSRSLGAVYGIPVDKDAPGATPDGWQPYTFPQGDPRSGILMQISFLALHSHPGRTSPTLRGKALRETILCQKVPDPPGNVNFNLVQDTKNPLYKTVRQRLEAHRTQATCAGCHKMMDPIGLSLENFDSIGTYRAGENGSSIDATGEIDGVKFSAADGLGKAVHDHPATAACLVNRMYAYAVGRTPTKSENEWLRADLMPSFAADGYRLKPPLMRDIATSDVFFRVVADPRDRNHADAAGLSSRSWTMNVTQRLAHLAPSQRGFMRGLLGGTVVSVALPFLDCFLNATVTALARGAPLPTRFGTWFWGCGLTPGRWEPKTVGRELRHAGRNCPCAAPYPRSVQHLQRLRRHFWTATGCCPISPASAVSRPARPARRTTRRSTC